MKRTKHILRSVSAAALGFLVSASTGWATTPDCEALAAQASARHGLPEGRLSAISRAESGRSIKGSGYRAWPWTLNVQGKGYYFPTREKALEHLEKVIAEGVRNVDVGCMQLNYRWHGGEFASIQEMMDPSANADYAARYLKTLRKETGNWDGATKYYHSREADRGTSYLSRVKRIQARLTNTPMPPADPVTPKEPQVRTASTQDKARQAQDKRFDGGGNLVQVTRSGNYWPNLALPEGALPNMSALYRARKQAKR